MFERLINFFQKRTEGVVVNPGSKQRLSARNNGWYSKESRVAYSASDESGVTVVVDTTIVRPWALEVEFARRSTFSPEDIIILGALVGLTLVEPPESD